LESDVDPHSRYSGRAGSASPDGARGEGGERKYKERYGQQLNRYYDEVISQLGQPQTLLLLGPGEAKLQLKDRLGRSKVLAKCIVAIETTDKLTDAQIAARVKEHCRLDR
jgi:hypothetical protein